MGDHTNIDEHDRRLLDHVRPPDWRSPTPRRMYDLVVVGGGTAGLVCAVGGAGLGARVALVERARLGGDCLNTGCVPSKALLRSAHVVREAGAGANLGVHATTEVDFAAVMSRVRARRADLAPHDAAARLRSAGVDVYFGTAWFDGPRAVVVASSNQPPGAAILGEHVLRFRKAVVATGSRPVLPAIPGLADVPVLTSQTLFELREQPRALVVLGAGPVGCEMAEAFARLGTRVTLVETASHVLPREDPDAATLVEQSLARAGVDVRVGARVVSVTRQATRVLVRTETGEVQADALLVAAGRAANVEGLALERAQIAYDDRGVVVDDRLRTTNPRVFAAGDVCSPFKFTHAADAFARIVLQNALFFGRRRASRITIPHCTFTSPEVAHVGLDAHAAAARGATTITVAFGDVDRAVVDDEGDGFVRIHHDRGTILGATIVGRGAGELIGAVGLALQAGRSLGDLSACVFPYPTLSIALRQAGDIHRRAALTPFSRRALHYYFRYFRLFR